MWAPPKTPVETTWAVASDLSEVVKTEDGFGIFPTELAALENLIGRIDAELETLGDAKRKAKRRWGYLRSKERHAGTQGVITDEIDAEMEGRTRDPD